MAQRPFPAVFFRVAVIITVCWILQAASAPASPPVRFSLIEGHWIVIPVSIKGSGPYDFLLDTGSNKSILDPLLIGELGGKVIGRTRLVTAAGSSLVSSYRLEDFQLGPQRVEHLDVLAHPVPDSKGLQIRGIIGQDFLGRFNFVLDYKSRTITFEEEREFQQTLNGGVHNLLDSAQRKLVQIPPQSGESRPSLFVLDSGAEGIVLFGDDFRGLGFDLNSASNVDQVQTVVGRGFVSRGQFRSFKVGDTTLMNLPVRLAQIEEPPKVRAENGLLPTAYFQSIYFNNVMRFVAFNPRFENRLQAKDK
jgi:predicted aspartyl protease